MTEMRIEAVTTEARRKRHLAKTEDLAPDRHAQRVPGRRGRTLCGYYGFDQERHDAEMQHRPWWKDRLIADLPLCKQCDKSAKSGAGRG